jgi:hypothetical protein
VDQKKKNKPSTLDLVQGRIQVRGATKMNPVMVG